MRENLNLNLRKDKIVLWRRITRALKDVYENNKDVVNMDTPNRVLSTDNLKIDTVDCGQWKPAPEVVRVS